MNLTRRQYVDAVRLGMSRARPELPPEIRERVIAAVSDPGTKKFIRGELTDEATGLHCAVGQVFHNENVARDAGLSNPHTVGGHIDSALFELVARGEVRDEESILIPDPDTIVIVEEDLPTPPG